MITTSIQDAGLSLGVLGALALGVVGIVVGAWKVFTILDGRITTKAHEASTVAVAKAAGVELKVDRVSDDLAAFKLAVAREYVPTDSLRRLEDRMDQGFSGLREMLIETMTGRSPGRRRPPD